MQSNTLYQTILQPECTLQTINDGITVAQVLTPDTCNELVGQVPVLSQDQSVAPNVIGSSTVLTILPTMTAGQVAPLSSPRSSVMDGIQRDSSVSNGILFAAVFFLFIIIFLIIRRNRRHSVKT